MADPLSGRARTVGATRITRRMALAPLVGLTVAPFLPVNAQAFGNPPVFRTVRRQFTLLEPRSQLPTTVLTDLRGRPARLAPVPGKVLLINVWATWCAACRLDLPLLERFQASIGDRVRVAAVSIDKTDLSRVGIYLDRLAIRHLAIYVDPDGRLASSDAASLAPLLYGIPATYLVTPSGWIAGYISGAADWLAEDAQRLLAYYASA